MANTKIPNSGQRHGRQGQIAPGGVDEQRSRNMAAIRSRNTRIEMRLRKALWAAGVRGYRVHYPLLGKPDIVFTRHRVAVFIDGCFWHRCPTCFRMPKTRIEYWGPKIAKNAARDEEINQKLQEASWTVIRIWEHEIEHELSRCVDRVIATLDVLG